MPPRPPLDPPMFIYRSIHDRRFYTLLCSHGHHVDDSTDRRQPIYHRVSSVTGVPVVHQLESEETDGCRVCLCCSVQYCSRCCLCVFRTSVHILHQRIACYIFTCSANMHPRSVEHSADKSVERSSPYTDTEPEHSERYFYDIRSRYRHHRRDHLSAAAALQRSPVSGRARVRADSELHM